MKKFAAVVGALVVVLGGTAWLQQRRASELEIRTYIAKRRLHSMALVMTDAMKSGCIQRPPLEKLFPPGSSDMGADYFTQRDPHYGFAVRFHFDARGCVDSVTEEPSAAYLDVPFEQVVNSDSDADFVRSLR